jgi:hypothetical protein
MKTTACPFGMVGVASILIVRPASARGPGGGGAGDGDSGGAVHGLERAEEVAAPEGVEHGIDNAERGLHRSGPSGWIRPLVGRRIPV